MHAGSTSSPKQDQVPGKKRKFEQRAQKDRDVKAPPTQPSTTGKSGGFGFRTTSAPDSYERWTKQSVSTESDTEQIGSLVVGNPQQSVSFERDLVIEHHDMGRLRYDGGR
jgi:hypothetical protein